MTNTLLWLYGSESGEYAVLDLPEGRIPPGRLTIGIAPSLQDLVGSRLHDLAQLGEPGYVIQHVLNHLHREQETAIQQARAEACQSGDDSDRVDLRRRSWPRPQAELAGLLGVRQQSVSRWAADAGCRPDLIPEQWRRLVRLYMDSQR